MLPSVEVAHSARLMQDLLPQVGEPTLTSNFAKINALYPFERASDGCRGYLAAALEHLEMWANHIAPLSFTADAESITRFRPAQTLSRAAIEAGAHAVWVMDATTERECARRHVCLVLDDLEEQRKAALPADKATMVDRRKTMLDRLSGSFTEEEISRFPGYMAIVKDAAITANRKGLNAPELNDADEIERLWRASAGSAHGKRWPAFTLQTVVKVLSVAPHTFVATTQIPDPAAITRILQLADAIVSYGVIQFANFAGYKPQLAEMMAAAKERLVAVVPKL